MEVIIYNYITTNLLDSKQYVGMHTTNNINDGYLGSGRYFTKVLKKYGRENFKKEIVCFCKTKEEAFNNEKILIEKYNTLKPSGYNLSPTGGIGVIGCCSEESRKNRSVKMIGNKLALGFKQPEELLIRKRKCSSGRVHSEESKQKMRKPKSEEAIKNMKKPKDYPITDEHRANLRLAWVNLDPEKKLKHKYRGARKVINIVTGDIYLSIKDASIITGVDYGYFYDQIMGISNNKTNFKLL